MWERANSIQYSYCGRFGKNLEGGLQIRGTNPGNILSNRQRAAFRLAVSPFGRFQMISVLRSLGILPETLARPYTGKGPPTILSGSTTSNSPSQLMQYRYWFGMWPGPRLTATCTFCFALEFRHSIVITDRARLFHHAFPSAWLGGIWFLRTSVKHSGCFLDIPGSRWNHA